jgi:hypothetical protein
MKTLWTILVFAVALVPAGRSAAQETLPPIPISGGQTTKYTIDDQAISITATGVDAMVYLSTVTGELVAGAVQRASSGTTQGQVLIRWENVDKAAVVWISAVSPNAAFAMRQLARSRDRQNVR